MKQKRRQKCWVTRTKKVSNFRQIDLPVFAIWNRRKCYHYRTESNNERTLEGDYFLRITALSSHMYEKTRGMKKFLQLAESSFSIISRLNNFFNNLFIVWPFSIIPFWGFQKAVFHCNIITHRLSTIRSCYVLTFW